MPDAPPKQPPKTVNALGSDQIALSRLLAVSDNFLLQRKPTTDEQAWRRAYSVPSSGFGEVVHGIAVPHVSRYLVIGDWLYAQQFYDGDDENAADYRESKFHRAGSADGVKIITAVTRLIVGARGTDLLAREALGIDCRWRRIGDVPAGTKALASYYGALYALDDAGVLWWRAATAVEEVGGERRLSAMHPGWVLGYRRRPFERNGIVGVYVFHLRGELRLEREVDEATIPANAQVVVGCGDDRHVLFAAGGKVISFRVVPFDGKLEQRDLRDIDPMTGSGVWALGLAIGPGSVLLYESTGTARVVGVDRDGKITIGKQRVLPAGITHMVATDRFDLLFYRSDGSAWTARWIDEASALSAVPAPALSAGWTHMAASGHRKVFVYSQPRREFAILRFDATTFKTVGHVPNSDVTQSSAPLRFAIGGVNGILLFVADDSVADARAEGGTSGIWDRSDDQVVMTGIRYHVPDWVVSKSGPWSVMTAV